MKSKRAEGAGKMLIQSQSSIWHKKYMSSRPQRLDPCFPRGQPPHGGPLQTVFFAGTPLGVPFFPYHTIRISFNGKGSLCSAMHISHGIIIKRNFARCLPAFYGSGLSLKGMLLRVACFIAHQSGTPCGLTLTLRLNEK